MYSGNAISLEQLLCSREKRADRQREWLKHHSLPLISFTVNMVGEVKVNALSRTAFAQGLKAIVSGCLESNAIILQSKDFELDTGLEYIAAVDNVTALELKTMMVAIEDSHPLGRMFDIDVLDIEGSALSRDTMGLLRRRCIVCSDDAKLCARSRKHAKHEIVEEMTRLVTQS